MNPITAVQGATIAIVATTETVIVIAAAPPVAVGIAVAAVGLGAAGLLCGTAYAISSVHFQGKR